jgi:integrase
MVGWDTFRDFMNSQYRKSTCHRYSYSCEMFKKRMGIQAPDQLRSLTADSVIGYINEVKARRKSEGALVDAYAIKAMLEFFDCADLASKVPAPKGFVLSSPKWLPEPLIHVMVDKYSPNALMAAIASVGYELGLRIQEAIQLDRVAQVGVPYVDPKTGRATVRRLKTKQWPWQEHQLGPWAMQHLSFYLAQRKDRHPALFVGPRSGERVDMRTLQHSWAEWMKKTIGLNADFRLLRHSRLTSMAIDGRDIIDIARFAGHSSVTPTLIYTHIAGAYRSNPSIVLKELEGSLLYREAQQIIAG